MQYSPLSWMSVLYVVVMAIDLILSVRTYRQRPQWSATEDQERRRKQMVIWHLIGTQGAIGAPLLGTWGVIVGVYTNALGYIGVVIAIPLYGISIAALLKGFGAQHKLRGEGSREGP